MKGTKEHEEKYVDLFLRVSSRPLLIIIFYTLGPLGCSARIASPICTMLAT